MKPDFVFRPEEGLEPGVWHAVAYIEIGGERKRLTDRVPRHNRLYRVFPTKEAAQARCDELNVGRKPFVPRAEREGWKPIDTAPNDDGYYRLSHWSGERCDWEYTGKRSGVGKSWSYEKGSLMPTHWKPLPPEFGPGRWA